VKEDIVGVSIHKKGKSIVFEEHVEIIDITTPQEERNPTFKRLKRQLKEARDEVDELKKEELVSERKIKGLMDMYHETIDKERFIAKRFLPLHRQLKNLYKQNRAHHAQIRELNTELQPFKEDLDERNIDMLGKDATRRRSRVRK
jgi:chromosome segregation ATPase